MADMSGCVNDVGDDSFVCPEDLNWDEWCTWCKANEEPGGQIEITRAPVVKDS